jgi:protein-S-isoprenylcysteine O-methyltransferase Ste14
MVAGNRPIIFEGKQIDIALAVLFAVMAFASVRSAANLGDRLTQVVLLGSVPIDVLGAYSFLVRRPALMPTMTNEVLVPFLSFFSPIIVLNSVLFFPATYSIPMAALIAVPGVILSVYSLVYLKRSFAILPAVRDVVSDGPYRLVRHPLYLGETMYLLGMMLILFSMVSVILFVVSLVLLLQRIRMEEKKLMSHPNYKAYAGRVRHRLIPLIY